jgi:phosphatidylglycerophosphate synthase
MKSKEVPMATKSIPASGSLDEVHRELAGLTSEMERRALAWLAARTPLPVGPDHLTILGAAGLGLAGAAYAASLHWPWLLLVVNVGLALNWLGDSLDGTLARYRGRTRPRYGHYVDHVVDGLGAAALLLGLAGSGWITPSVAVGLLLAHLLFLVHMGYAAHTTGRFTMSYGGLGGTELRIALAVANVVVLVWPTMSLGGVTVLLFDVLGAAALVGMAFLLVRALWETATALDRADRGEAAG